MKYLQNMYFGQNGGQNGKTFLRNSSTLNIA